MRYASAPGVAERFSFPGPLGERPRLAVAVSGGADSMALTLLARDWVAARGGEIIGLIVDHGLRPGSAVEAAGVQQRLRQLGVPARILTLSGLTRGADAARRGRHAALEAACADLGIVHLLFGHHAADQAETLQIRALAGSGAHGFAGMAVVQETTAIRRLRPLLGWPPERLREYLRRQGVVWVEDPSNVDQQAQRGRLRRLSANGGITALARAAARAGARRAAGEQRVAAWLGRHAMIFPEGFAVIPGGEVPAAALAALIQTLSGAPYPPASAAVARLTAELQQDRVTGRTLGGIVIRPAGRLGAGWLLAREVAAIGPAVRAGKGAMWDRRFRLLNADALPDGTIIEAVGADAARLRRHSHLPAYVLSSLPSLRHNGKLAAVPHLGYPDFAAVAMLRLQFSPARPVACAPWFESLPEGEFLEQI
jgi:tRNA(Ile)-lysidine synthase